MSGANGRVTLSDLTLDQLEQLELEVGLPVDRWDEGKSYAVLARSMLVVATGISAEEAGRLTVKQMRQRVSLRMEPDRDQEQPPQETSP